MEKVNKIICITISIICFLSISCRLSSIIDYDNQEEKRFIDMVLENQEQYTITVIPKQWVVERSFAQARKATQILERLQSKV